MANKHMKRYSISLIIRGIKIKNHNKIPFHIHQDSCNKKDRHKNVGKNVEEQEPSYIADGIVRWHSHSRK